MQPHPPAKLPFVGMLAALLTAALFTPAVSISELPPKPAKPSALLLVSDDLRPQLDIPGYSAGGAPVTTPHLQKLASEAVVFTRAYCQEALCAPSRNSFL